MILLLSSRPYLTVFIGRSVLSTFEFGLNHKQYKLVKTEFTDSEANSFDDHSVHYA